MSDRMTVEEWYTKLNTEGIEWGEARHILWDWQNDRVELMKVADDRKELLESIAKDIEENINPYMESAGLHPITQTLDAIEEELKDGSKS